MNRNSRSLPWVVFLAGAVHASLATATDLADRFAACAREQDDARRLACYDRESAHLPPVVRKEDDAVAGTTGEQQRAQKADDDFGVQGSELARQRRAQEQDRKATSERLTAAVTALSRRPRGELVLTLDNGQVWVQKDPQSHFPVKVGDSVTIIAGALGSFRLIASGRSTQVSRIQ